MKFIYRAFEEPYPRSWEQDYCDNLTVQEWAAEFPDLFYPGLGFSTRAGTLDLFAQHALMYLLRKRLEVKSLTWYSLAETNKNSKNQKRTLAAWSTMRKVIGAEHFSALRTALLEAGFQGVTGEPDLFCWYPDGSKWFFAEAKRKDKLLDSQLNWFGVCHKTLGDAADIRVYTLIPEDKLADEHRP
jgi:hypothetical protein